MMIVLAGMIGVGKTTYAQKLAESLGTTLFEEPVEDNPILPLYYRDLKRYAFALQIFFLNKRFKLIKEAFYEDNNVLDRSIYEDGLFTFINYERGNITKEEYELYCDLVDNMMEELDSLPKKAPDLLVYLSAKPAYIFENIRKRGRDYEQPTKENGLEDYYKDLISHYEDWYKAYNKSAKIAIEVDQYDILENEKDWQEVLNTITNHLPTTK
ncbi:MULTISPECIES: deoxynucleoside kinase [Terrabacteria group]|uniref:deoxynucleoside kinase n=1 Tax=Bacillati TaxID=1783272 RepID=UPI00193A15CB|nr:MULTISPECIES: deoxynucleoside kinase [Terrabacteria group]MBW9211862.1 deoxynucleoside kinase [Trueperella sp. zg.1013]QRG87334.1 deoxynucleoside kinase [Bulleidia sp. zg-1006]